MMAFSAVPAAAQDAGFRGGISVDPDQFYFGGHLETSPLVDRLHFRPNVEVGFGDDIMLVAANMEFVYKFERSGDWGIYAGGGPALNIYSFDDTDDSETEGGLNLLVGVETARGLFFEFKLGVVNFSVTSVCSVVNRLVYSSLAARADVGADKSLKY
jgi:hypothetical protein